MTRTQFLDAMEKEDEKSRNMTVSELIDELQKIKDKSLRLVFITPDNGKYRFSSAGEGYGDFCEIHLLWYE